jgi:hypothetical protein
MPKTLPYIVCILMMLAGIGTASAQEVPTIKASVDKNQILIGEPVRLNIDVKSPVTFGNQLPQFDSIPHFELIEKGNYDSLITGEGISYHLEWKLTSFDSGTRYIPAFSIIIGKQVYKTDSLAVEVSYGKIDTAQDYHDIKGIIDVENPDVKYIPWVVGAVTLLALFLFIWFIRFPFVREPEIVEQTFHHVGPAEEAMASLEKLKKMIHEDPSSVKKYYTGLHDTLRIFLNRRLNLVTMEKTSEELILSLSEMRMEREDFSKLSAALRMGDFVKFAKYIPGPNDNETNLEIIKSAIMYINENNK